MEAASVVVANFDSIHHQSMKNAFLFFIYNNIIMYYIMDSSSFVTCWYLSSLFFLLSAD